MKDPNSECEGLFAADEAVLLLQDWFRRRAKWMTKQNISLIDDLVQEMSMGVLMCQGENTLHFYKGRAVSRARDLLRKEKAQRIKAARYGLLSIPIMEDDDTPFIEGMIDFEERLKPRSRGKVITPDGKRRASA
jgi:hypothetical protein